MMSLIADYEERRYRTAPPAFDLAVGLKAWVEQGSRLRVHPDGSWERSRKATRLEVITRIAQVLGEQVAFVMPKERWFQLIDTNRYQPIDYVNQLVERVEQLAAKRRSKRPEEMQAAVEAVKASAERARCLLRAIGATHDIYEPTRFPFIENFKKEKRDKMERVVSSLEQKLAELRAIISVGELSESMSRTWSQLHHEAGELYSLQIQEYRVELAKRLCSDLQAIYPKLLTLLRTAPPEQWVWWDVAALAPDKISQLQQLRDGIELACYDSEGRRLINASTELLKFAKQIHNWRSVSNWAFLEQLGSRFWSLSRKQQASHLYEAKANVADSLQPAYQRRCAHYEKASAQTFSRLHELDKCQLLTKKCFERCGESRLVEILSEQLMKSSSLGDFLDKASTRLMLDPANPSVTQYLDLLACCCQEQNFPGVDTQALYQLKDSYEQSKAVVDQCAKKLLSNPLGEDVFEEPDMVLGCGKERFAVHRSIIGRLKDTREGFFTTLDRLKKGEYIYPEPTNSAPKTLQSTDAQMTPLVLRVLIALHYSVEVDPLIMHTHGAQVNSVLAWLYPGEPALTIDSPCWRA